MTLIAGIDLSWTGRHPSGICLLQPVAAGFELVRLEDRVMPPAEMATFLDGLGSDVVAAIDGPLAWRVAGHAERQLASAFGRFHAAPYSANEPFLRRRELTAGPELAEVLSARGFARLQGATDHLAARTMLEVYPHASHVAGFGLLKERLKYKKGRLADRLQWLAVYRDCLAAHVERLSPGAWPAIALALPPTDSGLGGRALKSVEDRMDAATCALAGFLAWRDGVTPCELFGEPTEGYIVVPGLREDGRFSRCREY